MLGLPGTSQLLGAIVVARQVQKEETWLCSVSLNSRDDPAVPVGVLLGVAEVILLELHNDERDLGLHHCLRLGFLANQSINQSITALICVPLLCLALL